MVHITPEWREEFENHGEDLVRHDVLVTQYMPPEKRAAARAWLDERRSARERVERIRFWAILIVGVLTLIVATLTLLRT